MRLLVFLSFIAVLAAQAPKGPSPDNAAGNPENGRRLFVKFGCYACHGYQGQGGAAGARLAPRPIALAALIAYLRHPSGNMPPFTDKVATNAELADIHAFLASIPAPPAAKDIPLLNQ